MKRLHALSLLLLIFCASTLARAQSTDATISGVVVDTAGKVIIDASIEILNEATGVHYSSRTNGTGIYSVTVLPPGQYIVQVSKIGFKTLIKPDIVLNVQSALALNFTLPIGAASESVAVDAGASSINTADASVSTVIDRQFVENMPLNGSSLQSLISLAPGVVQTPIPYGSSSGNSGEFSVNRQRTEIKYYTVDGVSANVGTGSNGSYTAGAAGLLPAQTALGTTQSMASVDALQEFRINTSTYSAEYGRTPGGQISLQTRSGTDALHGSLLDYFRNDALDANNWFNDHTAPTTAKTAERQNDFGGTLGGRSTCAIFTMGENARSSSIRMKAPLHARMEPVFGAGSWSFAFFHAWICCIRWTAADGRHLCRSWMRAFCSSLGVMGGAVPLLFCSNWRSMAASSS